MFTEIEALKSPVIINIHGDWFDCADLHVGDSAYEQIWDLNKQLKEAKKLVRPIRKKKNVQFRKAVPGNHEARLRKNHFDIMETFCEMLDMEYMADIDMKMRRVESEKIFVEKSSYVDKIYVNDKPLKLYGCHGNFINKRLDLAMAQLQRDKAKKDADIVMMGHNHRCHFWKDMIETSQDEGKAKWKYYGFTGHFISYPGGYADKKGLDMLPEGYLRMQVFDVRDKLFVEGKECFVDRYRPDLWKV